MSLSRLVWVLPGSKPRRQVFSRCDTWQQTISSFSFFSRILYQQDVDNAVFVIQSLYCLPVWQKPSSHWPAHISVILKPIKIHIVNKSVYTTLQYKMSHLMTKPTMWLCTQPDQISLGICPVWSESSLSTWRKLGSLATRWAHSEDWSDWADAQADLSPRWVHTHFVGLSWGGSNVILWGANCKFHLRVIAQHHLVIWGEGGSKSLCTGAITF